MARLPPPKLVSSTTKIKVAVAFSTIYGILYYIRVVLI
jgi:hypothetical protein